MSTGPAPRPDEGTRAAAVLRPVQLLSAAVGMGALMLTAVRVAVDPSAAMPSAASVAVVLLALLVAALLIRRTAYAVPALPPGLPRENAVATSLRVFTSTTTVCTALAEAPVLVAFAVSLALEPQSWLPLLLALPGALALFWLHGWPSARTAARVEAALEAGGARSHLSETLGFGARP